MAGRPKRRRRLAARRGSRRNPFMEAEVTDKQRWLEVDGPRGIEFFPLNYISRAEALKAYGSNRWTARTIMGYGVRMQAPGYLDATEWEVYTNQREALRRAREMERGD